MSGRHEDVAFEDLRPGKPGVRIMDPGGQGPDDGWAVRIYRRAGQLRADVGPGALDMSCQALIDLDWQFFVVEKEAGF